MAEPLLSVRGLWKRYGAGRPALIDGSFDLQRGEVLGIVGESGSGKTTLARCVALLVRPDRGEIRLSGLELTRLRGAALRRHRRRIQTVFQDPYASLNPRLTVGDALSEVLHVHRLVPRRGVAASVARLLDLVALPRDVVRRYPAALSGGQRQRVCIARALAAEPDILIADEAVSALDVSIRAQVLNLLADLRDELGLSMLFIGHDLLVVEHIANRLAVMLGGQIVELLPSGVPLGDARHPYTRELLRAAPTIANAMPLEDLGNVRPDAAGPPPTIGCPYLRRCPLRHDPRCASAYPVLTAMAQGHAVASFCAHDPAPGVIEPSVSRAGVNP